jgi:hypothetical protein
MNFDFLNDGDDLDQYNKILQSVADASEIEEIQFFIAGRNPFLAAKDAKLAGFDKKSLTLLYSMLMLELNKRREAFALVVSAYQLNAKRGRKCY